MTTVMLFEDEPVTRQWLIGHLEGAGFDVVAVQQGPRRTTPSDFAKVDAVVTDMLMPYYDGFDVMRLAREAEPDLPVIAISSFGPSAQVDYVRMSEELGADAAFEKPINIPRLIETLHRLTRTAGCA